MKSRKAIAKSTNSSVQSNWRISWFVRPVIATEAEDSGILKEFCIHIDGVTTTGSDEQFAGLCSGSLDAAVTAMDNVIMWNRRSGPHDFRIVAQIEANTGISLVARSEFATVDALAAKRILVDSAENGFVIALRAMLARSGVDFDACEVIEAGGVNERCQALIGGGGDATLLGPPFVELAQAKGLNRLADADAMFPGFPGQALVVRESLAAERQLELVRLLLALERARSACRADLTRTAALIERAGVPSQVAARLAGFVGESLLPHKDNVELLPAQRLKLALPGGGDKFEDLVDLRPLMQAGLADPGVSKGY